MLGSPQLVRRGIHESIDSDINTDLPFLPVLKHAKTTQSTQTNYEDIYKAKTIQTQTEGNSAPADELDMAI